MNEAKCIIKKRAWDNGNNTGLVESMVESKDLAVTFAELENKAPGESVHSIYIEGKDRDGHRKRYVFELKTVLTLE